MNKALLVSLPILLLTGCIQLKMPEHMVSDTVKAGKDLVKTVVGEDEKPAEAANGLLFTNLVTAEPEASAEAATEQCIQELEAHAREKLNRRQLSYRLVSKKFERRETDSVATCALEAL
jgi:hypothetical protein